jgi:hypothetical protein
MNARQDEMHIPLWQQGLSARVDVPPHASGAIVIATGAEPELEPALGRALHDTGYGVIELALLTPLEQRIDHLNRRQSADADEMAARLLFAAEHLAAHPVTDDLPLAFLGAGPYAAAALIAAAAHPEPARLATVVSIAGRTALAGDAIGHVPVPVLLVAGGHDYPSLRMNRDAYGQLPDGTSLEVLSATTAQLAISPAREEVLRLVTHWFDRRFGARALPGQASAH